MPPALVAFDVDGTLVHGFPPEAPYIWRVMHQAHGSPEGPLDEHRRRFFRGEISYDAWFQHDLHWLRAGGATRESLRRAFSVLHPVEGAREVFAALRSAGCRLAVISGSVDLLLDTFFPEVEFDQISLNRLHFDESGALVGGVSTPFDMEHKSDGLRAAAARAGLSLRDCAFVGDAMNDVAVARVSGLSVAFNCRSDDLARVCHHVVPAPASDLRVILPFLGL